MANKELDRIKNILIDKLDKKFVQDIIDQYKGQEEVVLEVLKDLFSEIITDADPFKWPMVSPEEFLDNPYYCGIDPKNGIGVVESIYPKLREDFIKVHSPESTIQEVVLTGSIGWGKSFFIELGLLWQLYYLSCLKYPQRFYNLAPDSPLGIIIVSVTERQGKKNIFSTIKGMVEKIPYFQENFMFNKKKQADSLIFPNKIEIFPASSSHSSNIGLNLFAGGMDEANFFRKIKNSKRSESGSGVFDAARTLYRSLRRRLDSRFMKFGKKPGLLYLGSSRVYPNDFTSEHIEEAKETEKKTGIQTVYVMDYNQWIVNRDAYSKQEFQVEIGELNRRSRILGAHDTPVGKVISVPMDFYDKFESDIENALRDIAGYGIHAIQPFIGNKDKIIEMFDDDIPRVFSVDTATLSPKPEFMSVEYILGKLKNPGKPRYVGLDIGITKDSFGFAMGYIDGYKAMKREFFNVETQQLDYFDEKLPICVIEMLLEIRPEKEYGEVEIARVRHLIFQLIKHGYKIRRSGCDGFQSKDMEQQLKRNGIKHEYISMDKTPEPYETFRTALYDGRIRSVYHPKLEIELNDLERDYSRNKIDHPVFSCFLGETKIKLLNGTDVRIDELVGKQDVELYGCLPSGKIVPVIAKKIYETKKVNEYCEVVLDNGEVIKCTPDHRFMLRNGEYKQAQFLTPEDSLMPLYSDHDGKFLKGYERIWDNESNVWRYTHAIVDEYYNGKRPNGVVVHHYDINPKNNERKNLERMTRSEHNRRHALLNELGNKPENVRKRVNTLKRNIRIKAGYDPNFPLAPYQVAYAKKRLTKEQLAQHYKEKNSSEKMRQVSSRTYKRLNETYWKSPEGVKRRMELSKTQLRDALNVRMEKEDALWISKFDTTQKYYTISQISKIYGGGRVAIKRRLGKIGYDLCHGEYKKSKRNMIPKSDEERQAITDKNDKKWLDRFDRNREYSGVNEIRRIYGGTRLDIIRRLNKIGFNKLKTKRPSVLLTKQNNYNHKIVSVKIVRCENEIPVYDIEVPLTSNFALSAGIFVHNSKDLADAVGSMVYNMHIDPVYANDDLMMSYVNMPSDEGGSKIHDTGDAEKDSFLDWITGGLIMK